MPADNSMITLVLTIILSVKTSTFRNEHGTQAAILYVEPASQIILAGNAGGQITNNRY